MKSRALLFVSALLVSSVWADAPVFDLGNESIKQIVRDTAGTQALPVQQLRDTKVVERELRLDIGYVQPVETPPAKSAPPKRVVAPHSNGFLSALFEILVDSAVDLALDDSSPRYEVWRPCQSVRDATPTDQISTLCAK